MGKRGDGETGRRRDEETARRGEWGGGALTGAEARVPTAPRLTMYDSRLTIQRAKRADHPRFSILDSPSSIPLALPPGGPAAGRAGVPSLGRFGSRPVSGPAFDGVVHGGRLYPGDFTHPVHRDGRTHPIGNEPSLRLSRCIEAGWVRHRDGELQPRSSV